jgi:hypothetical protein
MSKNNILKEDKNLIEIDKEKRNNSKLNDKKFK